MAPKHGNHVSESQDAYDFRVHSGKNPSYHCAISDGASRSLFSGQWAQILSTAACEKNSDLGELVDSHNELEEKWKAVLPNQVSLSWLMRSKLQRGSHATLLSVSFCLGCDGWKWSASGIGDCVLFHLSGKDVVYQFPELKGCDFGTRPELFPSKSEVRPEHFKSFIQRAEGRVKRGDTIFLMTDTIAQWVILHKKKTKVLNHFKSIKQDDFRQWMKVNFRRNLIKHDDLSILIARF